MAQQTRHLWHLIDSSLTSRDAGELDNHAASNWDKFYLQNKTNFFKDRHYLAREFPELSSGKHIILEVGCGVGNTAYPLLELNPHSEVYACDFAPSAVELVKAHPQYSCGRMHAFVADITSDDLMAEVTPEAVDICTMVFVLSAITPAKMRLAVANVAKVLKPGTGRVLMRDYAEGDLAQLRLARPTRKQRLSHNFYVRSDGTQAYYFTQDSLTSLFQTAGFTCNDYRVHERQIENRRQDVIMHRRWVQAVFTYNPAHATQTDPTAAHQEAVTHQSVPATSSNTRQDNQALLRPAGGAAQKAPASICQSAVVKEHGDAQRQQAGGQDDKLCDHDHQLPHQGKHVPSQEHGTADIQQTFQDTCQVSGSLDSASPDADSRQEGIAASCNVPQRQEWEDGGLGSEQDCITGCLFADSTPHDEVEEEVEIERGVLAGRVVSVSRQHRHTLEHTGLMRWESALPLARFLLALPSLTHGQQVLEVGCGVNPLCCLAALRHCRRFVATDGSLQALRGLANNLDLNCRIVIMERARLCPLAWGNAEQQTTITQKYGRFDTIIGADVVYAPDAMQSLFATCCALLTPDAHAKLVLCHIVRRVSEAFIIAVAAHFGLRLQEQQQSFEDAANEATADGPFRLLIFCRR